MAVRTQSGSFSFGRPYSYLGRIFLEIASYCPRPNFCSGAIFLGATLSQKWDIKSEALKRIDGLISSPKSSDIRLGAVKLVESLTFHIGIISQTMYNCFIGAVILRRPPMRLEDFIELSTPQPFLERRTPKSPIKRVQRIRTLVILGEDDRLFLSDELGELYRSTFPRPEVHIWPKVGHLPFFEEPEKTRDVILKWVNVLPPRYEPDVGNISIQVCHSHL